MSSPLRKMDSKTPLRQETHQNSGKHRDPSKPKIRRKVLSIEWYYYTRGEVLAHLEKLKRQRMQSPPTQKTESLHRPVNGTPSTSQQPDKSQRVGLSQAPTQQQSTDRSQRTSGPIVSVQQSLDKGQKAPIGSTSGEHTLEKLQRGGGPQAASQAPQPASKRPVQSPPPVTSASRPESVPAVRSSTNGLEVPQTSSTISGEYISSSAGRTKGQVTLMFEESKDPKLSSQPLKQTTPAVEPPKPQNGVTDQVANTNPKFKPALAVDHIRLNQEKKDKHYVLDIGGLEVVFPYHPYEDQLSYMAGLVTALDQPTHALLESPTGTGKSVCLLAVCLAWIKRSREIQEERFKDSRRREQLKALEEDEKELQRAEEILRLAEAGDDSDDDELIGGITADSPLPEINEKRKRGRPRKDEKEIREKLVKERDRILKQRERKEKKRRELDEKFVRHAIVFATRTHSQIHQIVQELKTLAYEPSMSFVGSREHLCIHDKVKNNEDRWERDLQCKIEAQSGKCPYREKQAYVGGPKYHLEKEAEKRIREEQLVKDNQTEVGTLDKTLDPANPVYIPTKEIGEKRIEEFSEYLISSKLAYDIEELETLCKSKKVCPYYASKQLMNKVDIVFMPYNYLTNVTLSPKYESLIKHSILIFDEAHNLERNAEEGCTFEVGLEDIQVVRSEISKNSFIQMARIQKTPGAPGEPTPQQLNTPAPHLTNLKKNSGKNAPIVLGPIQLDFVRGCCDYLSGVFSAKRESLKRLMRQADPRGFQETLKIDSCIKAIFGYGPTNPLKTPLAAPQHNPPYPPEGQRLRLNEQTLMTFVSYLETITKMQKTGEVNVGNHSFNISLERVYQFMSFLAILYSNYSQNQSSLKWFKLYANHFRAMFAIKPVNVGPGHVPGPGVDLGAMFSFKVKIWSLSPYYTFEKIKKMQPWSIVLTSGTLSPMETFESLFRTRFPVKLSCDHVINPEAQLFVGIPQFLVSRQGQKHQILMDYQNRENATTVELVGQFLIQLCRVVPAGVLVFFVSYNVLNDYVSGWKKKQCPDSGKTLFEALMNLKEVCMEDQNAKRQADSVNRFNSHYKRGAIFLAVCEGKLSEGINFKDDMARCVVVVGTPFANSQDVKQKEKRSYLDYIKQNVETEDVQIDGAEWYTQNAMRSLNQCVGRVIRHRNDYGSIILLDSRLLQVQMRQKISRWVRSSLKLYPTQDELLRELKRFFDRVADLIGGPDMEPDFSSMLSLGNIYEPVPALPMEAHKTPQERQQERLRREQEAREQEAREQESAKAALNSMANPANKSKFVIPVKSGAPEVKPYEDQTRMPNEHARKVFARSLPHSSDPIGLDRAMEMGLELPDYLRQNLKPASLYSDPGALSAVSLQTPATEADGEKLDDGSEEDDDTRLKRPTGPFDNPNLLKEVGRVKINSYPTTNTPDYMSQAYPYPPQGNVGIQMYGEYPAPQADPNGYQMPPQGYGMEDPSQIHQDPYSQYAVADTSVGALGYMFDHSGYAGYPGGGTHMTYPPNTAQPGVMISPPTTSTPGYTPDIFSQRKPTGLTFKTQPK